MGGRILTLFSCCFIAFLFLVMDFICRKARWLLPSCLLPFKVTALHLRLQCFWFLVEFQLQFSVTCIILAKVLETCWYFLFIALLFGHSRRSLTFCESAWPLSCLHRISALEAECAEFDLRKVALSRDCGISCETLWPKCLLKSKDVGAEIIFIKSLFIAFLTYSPLTFSALIRDFAASRHFKAAMFKSWVVSKYWKIVIHPWSRSYLGFYLGEGRTYCPTLLFFENFIV